MNKQDISDSINEVKEMAEELRHRIHLYKEATQDPEATISIPSIDHMYQLAEGFCKKLDDLTK